MADVRILANQVTPRVVAEGVPHDVRGTRDGIMFTANWKEALLMEGRVFQMTVGSLAAGGDISPITGGGNGTVINQDRPEFIVSVPSGTALIPLEVVVSVNGDVDADTEVIDIILTADTAAASATPGTATTETPVNMITSGGVAAAGSYFSAVNTADITDPTVSMILDSETLTLAAVSAAGALTYQLKMHYEPEVPPILIGPAALYGYWGGTAAATGVASVIWAEVPSTRYTL
ncbi:hypothetical protein LCGC14_1423580 [marine sediment metagenome]|uniref:Uncharacterized protein n=1 Tax=marine sediment metagenome TaxID=412755 RepID=A0A0F9KBP6_9ZZZZ